MSKTIVTFDPINDFVQFGRMMDRLLSGGAPRNLTSQSNGIPVDIFEQDGKLFIKAAVPGVSPEDLDVSVEDGVLTIKGETRHEEVTENTKVYRREYSYGEFTRSIRLPDDLDMESIEAKFDKGFVVISMRRIIEEKPKALKVPVQG